MHALIGSIILLLALAMVAGVKWVPADQVYSLYRSGKLHRLLHPGIHLVLPWLDRVRHRIYLSGQVLRFEEPLPDAHDVRAAVYWQVLEPERADAVIEDADQLIRGGALAALRKEPEAYRTDSRMLGSRLKQSMNHTLRERGVMVTRVELDFA